MADQKIGKQRLILGDCREVLRELHLEGVSLVLTDPPYGHKLTEWDNWPDKQVWRLCYEAMLPGAALLSFMANRGNKLARLVAELEEAGFETDWPWLYWAQGNGLPKAKGERPKGKLALKPAVQPIVHVRKPGDPIPYDIGSATIPFRDEQDASTARRNRTQWWESLSAAQAAANRSLWDGPQQKRLLSGRYPAELVCIGVPGEWAKYFDITNWALAYFPDERQGSLCWLQHSGAPDGRNRHPTRKPVRLLAWLIKLFSAQFVLDPFAGSGSIAVACELLGIPGVHIEVQREYFRIMCGRVKWAVEQKRNCDKQQDKEQLRLWQLS
ncbi:MAG: site-specific DNA-methyltransferase [Deltaproteobacteria bacterium]|nr:site-specific DNA-methyltransferase [Deltaproteobacteria bacterium]